MGVPTLSKSNCYNQVCSSSHRFQNRTVTTRSVGVPTLSKLNLQIRFVGVPTDFKIELLQPGLQ
ncbi:hypothetical protein LEP1GSC033_4649 [Leptospira interrogans str. 2002000632]|uniref:Uncharacterized protein n=1 Tax=Leptospira interrogans str. 2002000626 TaxID=996803 RepID=A0A829DBE7_LEPIR|nr:hypothetical protein LEP1GSC033_4649 [Leptospira interrogans str. 2002000632]EMY06159.1 hypothetical protein LEP1GSC029_3064 [Leptospira interrogans str. 2002000626]